MGGVFSCLVDCLGITANVPRLGDSGAPEAGKFQLKYKIKIENNATDARFATILKVFRALDAKINFNIELQNQKFAY